MRPPPVPAVGPSVWIGPKVAYMLSLVARRYSNPWPGSTVAGFGSVLKWMGQRARTRRAADPSPSSFPVSSPAFHAPRAGDGILTVTWVGHASTLLQLGPLNVLTDPMWSERASPLRFAGPRRWVRPGIAFDDLPPLDLVVLSHDHYDHFDRRTLRRIVRRHTEARWVAPVGVGDSCDDSARRRSASMAGGIARRQTTWG